jgi:putative addiction module component (TIGR02574 family)
MNLEETISHITSLPVDERLRLIQAVWESLPPDVDCGVSPKQHAELDRRVAAHDSDPSSSVSRDELTRRLRGDT